MDGFSGGIRNERRVLFVTCICPGEMIGGDVYEDDLEEMCRNYLAHTLIRATKGRMMSTMTPTSGTTPSTRSALLAQPGLSSQRSSNRTAPIFSAASFAGAISTAVTVRSRRQVIWFCGFIFVFRFCE